MTYGDYIQLKEEFPDKLFIIISHARGKNPKGDAATSVMYDADLKIWVEGYVAYSKGAVPRFHQQICDLGNWGFGKWQ